MFARLILILSLLTPVGCGTEGSDTSAPRDGGATSGADGGSADGGSTDGGSTDGGSTDGGSTDGGSTGDTGSRSGHTGDSAPPGDSAAEVDPTTLLVINELMADNVSSVASAEGSYPDWIELYSLTGEDLDLSGFWLTDDLSEPYKHALPEGTILSAGGFLLLWADGEPELGAQHLGFKLDEAGEELGIYTPEGRAINLLTFGPQYPDLGAARVPDGGETWQYTYEVTPGSTNTPPEPEPFEALPEGSDWLYLVGSSAPAGDWTAPGYDDSGWSSGAAPLGYGDSHQVTTIPYGPDAGDKFITSWFRREVVLEAPAEIVSMSLGVMADDGLVVYLNGAEVLRHNMAEGAVTSETLASVTVGGADEYTFYSYSLDPSGVVEGSNQLAVEVHQAAPDSSDLTFDLRISGERLSD